MNINEIGEIMDKTNFKFVRLDNSDDHRNYWFETDKISNEELSNKYMAQSMIGITEVVYCKYNGNMGVKRIFPFNFDIVVVDDPELRSILEELIEEL